MHPNALKSTQGFAYSPCSTWPCVSVKCLSGLSVQTYTVTFIRWTRTPGARQKCLLPQVQMGLEPSELRQTTSKRRLRMLCCQRTTAPDHPGARGLEVEYSQPCSLCSSCSSCDHPTSSTVKMNSVMCGHCGHKNRV